MMHYISVCICFTMILSILHVIVAYNLYQFTPQEVTTVDGVQVGEVSKQGSVTQCAAECGHTSQCRFASFLDGKCISWSSLSAANGMSATHDLTGSQVFLKTILCADGWSKHKDSCYKFFNISMDANHSTEHCTSHGAYLAEIYSAEENAFIVNLAVGSHSDTILLSGNDQKQEGSWVWPSGGSIDNTTYSNWGSNEPSNRNAIEHCMSIRVYGKWNDVSCEYEAAFVCQTVRGFA